MYFTAYRTDGRYIICTPYLTYSIHDTPNPNPRGNWPTFLIAFDARRASLEMPKGKKSHFLPQIPLSRLGDKDKKEKEI